MAQKIVRANGEKTEAKKTTKAAATKKASKRREAFPVQLSAVRQEGGASGEIEGVSGQDYMDRFGFRGGEFGNWMSEADRRASLDMGMAALRNLALALDVPESAISLGGKLAIAFGARGHSSAAAHYEPERNVINLTKMSGAGCLAHEWGHALDAYIGAAASGRHGLYTSGHRGNPEMDAIMKACDRKDAKREYDAGAALGRAEQCVSAFLRAELPRLPQESLQDALAIASASGPSSEEAHEAVQKISSLAKAATGRGLRKESRLSLMAEIGVAARIRESIRKDGRVQTVPARVKTEYKAGSEWFDSHYARRGGYWQSAEEMFARAFDCYVLDKLKAKGITDTYLTAHADAYHITDPDGTVHRAYPFGEERETLNALFDALFGKLRRDPVFMGEPAGGGQQLP